MNDMTRAQLASALRTILSAATGFLLAKYIPDLIWQAIIAFVAMACICTWSVLQKQADCLSVIPQLAGVARNVLSALLTFAVTRGWFTQEYANEILGAVGVLVLYLWSAEQKYLVNKEG